MELFQFRHSAFCEKVRLILAAKGQPYDVREVTPGLGQLELFRLSGQRQVPLLLDGGETIADSTAIALHLERRFPDPPLLPADPADRAQVRLLEDWADTALASGSRLALLQAAAEDGALRSALLPMATPDPLRQLFGAVPADLFSGLTPLLRPERLQLIQGLEQLVALLAVRPYLVGDRPTLADLAVAAQLYLLRFPAVAGVDLAARGVAGIADQPAFEPLFSWRDELYRTVGRRAEGPPSTEPVTIMVD